MPSPHAALHLVAALSDEEALDEAARRFPGSVPLRIRSGASPELARIVEAVGAADGATIVAALDADVAAEHVASRLERLLDGAAPRLTVLSVLSLGELEAQLSGYGSVPSELVVDRLEAADIVQLADARDARPNGRAMAVARALAPTARFGDEPLRIAHRGRPAPAWSQLAASGRGSEWFATDLRALHLSDPRPFHPERLMTALTERFVGEHVGRIAAARGVARVATRPGELVEFSGLGDALHLGLLRAGEEAPSGHELVVLGWGLRPAALEAALLDAVLSPAELLAGPEQWRSFPDRLPLTTRSER
ncbi:GTP-binding protein [Arenivirga flava]|uniref:CobW C-terminal domain-containing protein n=1 Tax=Arenivirga flava TaxID=1930060 RepID=A0AA37XAI4_9MICO|nr:GTP-binding protein [Arenivirga flava]GMA27450.1 hypothetical protein GCM10025874_07030 [Arenivirga flava]